MIDPSLKNQNESNYINMINYLISSLNKAKSATIPNQLHNKPIFLYEFFVFELYLPTLLLFFPFGYTILLHVYFIL